MAKEHYRNGRITYESARALIAGGESVSIPGLGVINNLAQLPPPEDFEKGFVTGRARAIEGHIREIRRRETEIQALQLREEAEGVARELAETRRDPSMVGPRTTLPGFKIDDPQGVGRVASPADTSAVLATSRIPPGTVDAAPGGHEYTPLGTVARAPKSATGGLRDVGGNVGPVIEGVVIGGKVYRVVPDEPEPAEEDEDAPKKIGAGETSVRGEGEPTAYTGNPADATTFAPGGSRRPGAGVQPLGVVMGGKPGEGGGTGDEGGALTPAATTERKVYTPSTPLEEVDDLPAVHILRKHYKTLGEVDAAAGNGEGDENELVKLDGIKDVRLAQIREFFAQLKAGTLPSQQEQPPQE